MPVRIDNITNETNQRHVILLGESEVVLLLSYYPTVGIWCFSFEYKGVFGSGYKLSAGGLHMSSRNLPFDFTVEVNDDSGLDPFRADDFEAGRCSLYMLDAADMELLRATPVPL